MAGWKIYTEAVREYFAGVRVGYSLSSTAPRFPAMPFGVRYRQPRRYQLIAQALAIDVHVSNQPEEKLRSIWRSSRRSASRRAATVNCLASRASTYLPGRDPLGKPVPFLDLYAVTTPLIFWLDGHRIFLNKNE